MSLVICSYCYIEYIVYLKLLVTPVSVLWPRKLSYPEVKRRGRCSSAFGLFLAEGGAGRKGWNALSPELKAGTTSLRVASKKFTPL